MALSSEMEKAYNEQITRELGSGHQYLAFSAWFDSEGLPGMAHWMRLQADEERDHAMRIFQFVLDRDGKVSLGAIDAPETDFTHPIDVFERALAQEQAVTASIYVLYAMAVDTGDFASVPLLDWFVKEQVEEEATVQQIIDDLRRAGAEGHALLMLDRELGARTAAGIP
jgi:ferritin